MKVHTAVDGLSEGAPPAIGALLIAMAQEVDGDFRLGTLADAAGLPAFRLYRQFLGAVGETPKQHVTRLRLERAAQLLADTGRTALDIGFEVGFRNPETFIRAFRRMFGQTPVAFRRRVKAIQAERMERNRGFAGACCRLSPVHIETMAWTPLLAIRRLAPYANTSSADRTRLWDEIAAWALANGIVPGPLRLGLYPDDLVLTPPLQQSADLCIPIAAPAAGNGRVRGVTLPGGLYAVIDHFGPYETLIQAYRAVEDEVRRSPRLAFRDGPRIQAFQPAEESAPGVGRSTSVWIPVQRRP